jgi:hypothetical protein
VYLDCDGTLQKVEELPPLRISLHCKHVDILKNILVNCTSLSILVVFQHIQAHQDDKTDFSLLSRPTPLKCAVDTGAKQALQDAYTTATQLNCRRFPLEPTVCYVGREKMTLDTGPFVSFWAH